MEEKLEELKVKTWPIWTKEASTFDWFYDDIATESEKSSPYNSNRYYFCGLTEFFLLNAN